MQLALDPEWPPAGLPAATTRLVAAGERQRCCLLTTSRACWFVLGEGLGGVTTALPLPPERALVILRGRAYLLRASGQARLLGEPFESAVPLPAAHGPGALLLSPNEALRLGPGGLAWTSERLAADGLSFRRFDGERVLLWAEAEGAALELDLADGSRRG